MHVSTATIADQHCLEVLLVKVLLAPHTPDGTAQHTVQLVQSNTLVKYSYRCCCCENTTPPPLLTALPSL